LNAVSPPIPMRVTVAVPARLHLGFLDLTGGVRDLRAIARRRGGELVIVTRRKTVITPALSGAVTRWSTRSAGRVRVVRCI